MKKAGSTDMKVPTSPPAGAKRQQRGNLAHAITAPRGKERNTVGGKKLRPGLQNRFAGVFTPRRPFFPIFIAISLDFRHGAMIQ